jgi:hypothetical protein
VWNWRVSSETAGKNRSGKKIPNTQLVPFILDNEELFEQGYQSARRIHDAVAMGPTSAFSAAAVIAMATDPDRWRDFEVAAASGAGLDVDDPVLAMRTWWLRRGPASSSHESTLRAYTVMRAFIAFRSGHRMQRLNVVDRPILPDDFRWDLLKWQTGLA